MTETTQTTSGLSRPVPGGLGSKDDKKCPICGANVHPAFCWCHGDQAKE